MSGPLAAWGRIPGTNNVHRRVLVAALVSIALWVGPCASTDSAHANRVESVAAPRCDRTLTSPDQVPPALRDAKPGNTLCFSGSGFTQFDLVMTTPGTPNAPITLSAGGTRFRSVKVATDHVAVDGFVVHGGDGLALRGSGNIARNNVIRDAHLYGIVCRSCTGTLIERNTVLRTDGTGILIEGDRISVRRNDVSGSVKRKADDADGVRFFGSGHQISENTIHDIKEAGYVRNPPHADCLRTFDNGEPPTTNATLFANRCLNDDCLCLNATAENAGKLGQVGRSRTINFISNTCDVGGSEAVVAEWFPDVQLMNNQIGGWAMDVGVWMSDGSRDGMVIRNFFRGRFRPFEVDDSSAPGFRAGWNGPG